MSQCIDYLLHCSTPPWPLEVCFAVQAQPIQSLWALMSQMELSSWPCDTHLTLSVPGIKETATKLPTFRSYLIVDSAIFVSAWVV